MSSSVVLGLLSLGRLLRATSTLLRDKDGIALGLHWDNIPFGTTLGDNTSWQYFVAYLGSGGRAGDRFFLVSFFT